MNGATEDPPPKTSNAPIRSNTNTIGVIHQALRCHKNPNKSFRKSIVPLLWMQRLENLHQIFQFLVQKPSFTYKIAPNTPPVRRINGYCTLRDLVDKY
jgi:hypothetical protein